MIFSAYLTYPLVSPSLISPSLVSPSLISLSLISHSLISPSLVSPSLISLNVAHIVIKLNQWSPAVDTVALLWYESYIL